MKEKNVYILVWKDTEGNEFIEEQQDGRPVMFTNKKLAFKSRNMKKNHRVVQLVEFIYRDVKR